MSSLYASGDSANLPWQITRSGEGIIVGKGNRYHHSHFTV